MDDSQATRNSLLIRLGDGSDKQAWFDFVDLYSPVVYGFARRQGLQDAHAADLVQEVLRSVARSLPCFNPQKGRFPHLLSESSQVLWPRARSVGSPARPWPANLTISPASGEDFGGGRWVPFLAEEPNDLAGERRGFRRGRLFRLFWVE